jgi:F-type H+-transporting ATPase subunit epsilon
VAKSFHCSIVTPAEEVLSADATYADIPAWDGQVGILPGMSAFLGKLGIGELRLNLTDGSARRFYVEGGFVQVQNNSVVILTERAISEDKVNITEAEAELTEARTRIGKPGQDLAGAERSQARAMAKIRVARHRRTA